MITISLIVNSEVFFEFSVHQNNLNSLHSYETGDYPIYSTSMYYSGDYKAPYGSNSSAPSVLSGLRYARVLTVDVVYILVSFLVDLKLFLFVKAKIKKNHEVAHEIELTVMSRTLVGSDRLKHRILEMKRRKKDSILKNRITGIIILNGVSFILFRLPSVLLSFALLFFSFDQSTVNFKPSGFAYKFCVVFRFCDLLRELNLIFYLSSFLMQFFILFKLDKNLKTSILKILFKSRA